MLTSGFLTFLCIGVFASCMPTSKLPENLLKTLNEEIQRDLETIIKDLKNQVVTMGPSNMMAPVLIPISITEKQCAKLKLKAFIKLLNLWNTEGHEEMMQKMREKLQDLENKLASQEEKSEQNCEEKEYTHHKFSQVLDDLQWFLKDLYCILENCHN